MLLISHAPACAAACVPWRWDLSLPGPVAAPRPFLYHAPRHSSQAAYCTGGRQGSNQSTSKVRGFTTDPGEPVRAGGQHCSACKSLPSTHSHAWVTPAPVHGKPRRQWEPTACQVVFTHRKFTRKCECPPDTSKSLFPNLMRSCAERLACPAAGAAAVVGAADACTFRRSFWLPAVRWAPLVGPARGGGERRQRMLLCQAVTNLQNNNI